MLDALRPHPHRGDLIAAGVVPLTLGVVMVNVRMGGTWGDGALFVVTAVACAFVAALAILAPLEEDTPRAYHSVLLVAALVLVAFTLIRLGHLLGADGLGAGLLTWTAILFSVKATWLAARAHSGICTFIAAVGAGVATVAFVNWAFEPESFSTYRWILLLLVLVYIVGHLRLRDSAPRHAPALAIAAGVAVLAQAAVLGRLISFVLVGDSSDGWEFVVLACAFGLLAYAAVDSQPGAGYQGFFALAAFALVAGRPHPDATLLGWPLLLVIGGGIAIGFGLRPREDLPPEPWAPPEPPVPPAPMRTPPRPSEAPTTTVPASEKPTEAAPKPGEEPTEIKPPDGAK
jgi:hypothetical protein